MVSLGEGLGSGTGVWWGGFPVENEGSVVGGGFGGEGGWEQAKELASQCARICQNYPLAIYLLFLPDVWGGRFLGWVSFPSTVPSDTKLTKKSSEIIS